MSLFGNPPKNSDPKTQPPGFWIAIGVSVGAGFGVAINNIALGVGLGVAFGALIGFLQQRKNKKGPNGAA